MESTMRDSSEPKGRNAAARADSVRSLSCYSVDENVLEVLWDEKVDMEELLEFSFDHIDKLAERRGKTIASPEKFHLWEYVQQMKREQPYWVTKEAVPWDEVEAKYSLRSRSLSSGSLHCHLALSGVGLATPPPLLYSLRKPLPATSRGTATNENSSQPPDQHKCEPNERFTLSEQWDSGSPHRGHVVSATRFKKKPGWQRLLGKVFHQKRKDLSKDDSSGEFASFLAGVANSSSPCSVSHEEGSQASLKGPEKKRPTGFLRRSLRRVTTATRKRDSHDVVKTDV
ncbi:uncharacterized protein [Dermacentor andersoni]|uniref:uncharacterized protein n=1 Tax=Dermacentor andersoni TaxID=34620 RepID=UPI00215513CA|nr:uncharacterized protein LOC129380065 [Dermacentor andersoni]